MGPFAVQRTMTFISYGLNRYFWNYDNITF